MAFLPVSRADMEARGWEQADFVLVTGDAYVDHPSFGSAILSRMLEDHGYRVAILAQPDWRSAADFRRFGRPRLAFLINSGNVDSMVNHFSVFKQRRKKDSYSPGGEAGHRPDRAVTVRLYTVPSVQAASTTKFPRPTRPWNRPSLAHAPGRAGSTSRKPAWLWRSISQTPARPPKFPSIWKGG